MLAASVVLFASLLHPRIGLREIDAFGYVVGAISLRRGDGFNWLTGPPIQPWPSGYSRILAYFSNPKIGALLVNYGSLGIATALVYLLARQSRWSRPHASLLALALGLGFFRGMATDAAPDILTYAVFLTGLFLFRWDRTIWISWGLWASLVFLKSLAVVFVLAPLLMTVNSRPVSPRQKLFLWVLVVATGLGAVIVSGSYLEYFLSELSSLGATPVVVLKELALRLLRMATSTLREGLCYCHGTVFSPPALLFGYTLLSGLAVASLSTLRPLAQEDRLRRLGVISLLLFLSLALFGFNHVRQFGYALLILLLTFRPKEKSMLPWGAFVVFLGVFGIAAERTRVSVGGNHEHYESLAFELAGSVAELQPISTNGEPLLDVHAGVATQQISWHWFQKLPTGSYFLEIKAPQFDPMFLPAHRWWSPSRPEWEAKQEWRDATLWLRVAPVKN